jgi:S1-C subfamily serine protease
MIKKQLIAILALAVFINNSSAQSSPETMLDQTLSSIITVGVFKTESTNQVLGFRGPSDLAYNNKTDLSGSESSGSGFVIEANGVKYVATNAHVIQKAKTEKGAMYVFSISGKKYEVKVKGGDSFYDFAILDFVDAPGPEFSAIKFSNDEPKVGQTVYAIGNPLGEYPYSVTDGIISAKNRVRGGLTGKFGFLQTTATVIWGNSGGPLVNAKGEVVGMNSQIAFADVQNTSIWQPQINFALEAKICQRLLNDIINNNGRVKRAYMGLELSQQYTAEMDYTTFKKIVKKQDQLPILTNVAANSPAFTSLSSKVGYAITKVNDVETRSIQEVLGEFENVKPNTKVTLTIMKGATTENVSFNAGELDPSKSSEFAKNMIEKNPSYKVTSSGSNVTITFKEEYSSSYENSYKSKWQQSNEFRVIGVGMVGRSQSEVWRVTSLADLGIGIRFFGLTGFYDLITVDANNTDEQPKSTRIYLSGNEDISKQTLWY